MRWSTLFHLDPLFHVEPDAVPLPLDRVELSMTHGGRAGMDDVSHAVADLLTHAMPFVADGEPGLVPLDPEHPEDEGAWHYMLRLPSGSAQTRGRPSTGDVVGEETDIQAHSVTVKGTRDFAVAVGEAIQALRAVPGLVEHLSGQKSELDAALARAAAAEQRIQDIWDQDDA